MNRRNFFRALSALVILLLYEACASPIHRYSAQGIVRNVWCHPEVLVSTCDVVFEHDSGPLQSMTFYGGSVPLWAGLHAKLIYHNVDSSVDHLDFVQRL